MVLLPVFRERSRGLLHWQPTLSNLSIFGRKSEVNVNWENTVPDMQSSKRCSLKKVSLLTKIGLKLVASTIPILRGSSENEY